MRAATLLSPIFILSLTTECTSNVSLGNLGGGAAGARRTLSPSPTAEHSTSKASAEILGASTAAVALLRALAELRQPAAATVATKATGGEALPLHATRPAARGHLHSPLHLLISPARLGTDDITAFSAHRSTASAAPTKLSAETTAVSLKSCTKGSNCASEDEAVSGSGSGVARQWQSPQRRALTFRGGGGDVAGYETGVIDEDLYSRQLYVMGKSAMVKMGKADVLISGMSGLGAEVAKNIILAGVRSVTLHDDRPASTEDLSSHFAIGEDTAARGTPRARASVDHLRELNPYVDVRLLEMSPKLMTVLVKVQQAL